MNAEMEFIRRHHSADYTQQEVKITIDFHSQAADSSRSRIRSEVTQQQAARDAKAALDAAYAEATEALDALSSVKLESQSTL